MALLSNLDDELQSSAVSQSHNHSPSHRKQFLPETQKNISLLQGVKSDSPKESHTIHNQGEEKGNNTKTQQGKENIKTKYDQFCTSSDSKKIDNDQKGQFRSMHHKSDSGSRTVSSKSQPKWGPQKTSDLPPFDSGVGTSTETKCQGISIVKKSKEYLEPNDETDFFAAVEKELEAKEDDEFWGSPKLKRPSSSRTTGIRGEMTRSSSSRGSSRMESAVHHEQPHDLLSNAVHGDAAALNVNFECEDPGLNLLPFHGSNRPGSSRLSGIRGELAEYKDRTDPLLSLNREQPQVTSPMQSSQISPTACSTDTRRVLAPHPALSVSSSQRARLKTAVLQESKLPSQIVPSSNGGTTLKQEDNLLPFIPESSRRQPTEEKVRRFEPFLYRFLLIVLPTRFLQVKHHT